MKIYQIDSSARKEGSTSRALAKKVLEKIKKPGDEVIYRDLNEEMVFVTGLTESGMNIKEEDQNENHKKMFKLSQTIIARPFRFYIFTVKFLTYPFEFIYVFLDFS